MARRICEELAAARLPAERILAALVHVPAALRGRSVYGHPADGVLCSVAEGGGVDAWS